VGPVIQATWTLEFEDGFLMGLVVLNHICYVVLGLNWPYDPSLIPGSLELQMLG